MPIMRRAGRFLGPWLAFAALSGITSSLVGGFATAILFLCSGEWIGAPQDALSQFISFMPASLVGGFSFGLIASLMGGRIGIAWAFLATVGLALTTLPPVSRSWSVLMPMLFLAAPFNVLGAICAASCLENKFDGFRWGRPMQKWLQRTWLKSPPWWTRSVSVLMVLPLWFLLNIMLMANYLSGTKYVERMGMDALWWHSERLAGFVQREDNRVPSCSSNLRQIQMALLQYSADYDDRFPSKPSSAEMSVPAVIQPYLKTTSIFQCPNEPLYEVQPFSSEDFTDYWFNARLHGQSEMGIEYTSSVVAWGDGNTGAGEANATYSLTGLPDNFGPAYRHRDGANYAFVDGHVKWLKAGEVSNQSTKLKYPIQPTFIP